MGLGKREGTGRRTRGRLSLCAFALCLLPFSLIFCGASGSYGTYDGAKYLRNYDGDTVTFDLTGLHPIIGKSISIRVNGIDTPEMRGKCAAEKSLARKAKVFVENILKNSKNIRLENMQRGKYFRIVARVTADDHNLAEMLLAQGLAVAYDGGKKSAPWCG